MNLISYFLTLILAAYTVLVEPFARTNLYRNLKKQLSVDPNARLPFYRIQILWELSWVVIIALIFLPKPQQLPLIGIALPNPVGWLITAALLIGVFLSTYLLRRSPTAMANMQRSLSASSVLLPSTPAERNWYAASSVVAGICEELLYRGFFIYFLWTTFPMFNEIIILSVISGIVYGLSRAYQGSRGILQAGLMGFSFAVVFFLSRSLLPAIVFHILADLRNLFFWPEQTNKKKAK